MILSIFKNVLNQNLNNFIIINVQIMLIELPYIF